MFPSNPRYSAGARASSRVTPGAPSRPRTSDVVRCIRFGPRGVNGVDGFGGGSLGAARRPAGPRSPRPGTRRRGSRTCSSAVRAERSTRRGRRTAPACRRRRRSWCPSPIPARAATSAIRSGTASADRIGVLGLIDEVGAPVDVAGARDLAGPVDVDAGPIRAPAGIEDAHALATQMLGQPLGRGKELGAGQAGHRRYDTAVVAPLPARCGPPGRGPGGPPSARGRDLPEHGLGRAACPPRRQPRWHELAAVRAHAPVAPTSTTSTRRSSGWPRPGPRSPPS